MKQSNPTVIPPANICPKKYCYFFLEPNDYYAQSLHNNLKQAMNKLELIEQESCGCEFGICIRINNDGDADWYEPCKPALEKDGLPQDYFINKTALIND